MARKFICIGEAPLNGCGVTLSVIERRRGFICEYCNLDLQYRVRAWHLGQEDEELEELFGDASFAIAKNPINKAA